ncbi:MAG: HDOD domain-containing protein [Thermodesulfobacteriota bacterium]|nr:HDOD domain-containing protein [Thermodesulfobacteriota bacterium]
MGTIPVNRLKENMVLAEDVRDLNTRLLLAKNLKIQSKHVRILKMWGIAEVKVVADEPDFAETPAKEIDSEALDTLKKRTQHLFRHVDLQHPAMQELFRLSVLYKIQQDTYISEKKKMGIIADAKEKLITDLRNNIAYQKIKLPEIPSTVFELNEIIANPLASADDIARVVSKSPSLTAILLKIVNSPVYAFPTRVDTISRAVTLIGTQEISGLALGISVISIFKDIPQDMIDMHLFLKHSLICAIISRVLCAYKNITQTEQLFVSGLLHDIGRLVLYKYYPEPFKQILFRAESSKELLHTQEKKGLGCKHTDIGKDLLKKWKIPLSIGNNVFYHHNPSGANNQAHATIVHLADIIAHSLEIGTSGERFVPNFDHQAFGRLGISPSCFDSVIRLATHQFNAIESFFN